MSKILDNMAIIASGSYAALCSLVIPSAAREILGVSRADFATQEESGEKLRILFRLVKSFAAAHPGLTFPVAQAYIAAIDMWLHSESTSPVVLPADCHHFLIPPDQTNERGFVYHNLLELMTEADRLGECQEDDDDAAVYELISQELCKVMEYWAACELSKSIALALLQQKSCKDILDLFQQMSKLTWTGSFDVILTKAVEITQKVIHAPDPSCLATHETYRARQQDVADMDVYLQKVLGEMAVVW